TEFSISYQGDGGDEVVLTQLTPSPQAPAFTSAGNTTFTVGSAGSFTVTASGYPLPTLSENSSDTLPSGVTFNATTGVLSGTPAAGSAGTYTLNFTAANSGGSVTQTFTLTVNQTPAITSGNSVTFATGQYSSFTVTATGLPTPSLTESGALPSGVTFTDNGDGTAALDGVPADGTKGTYHFSITAGNGVGSDFTQNFTLTVTQAQAPAITSGSSATFTAGQGGSFTVTATGSPTPSLTESGAMPGGVTFTDNGNGTATLAGAPDAGSGGTYTLYFTAANSAGSVSQTFTLTVNQPQAPVITSGTSATFTAGQGGSFTVTATGSPTPTLTESGAMPSGVAFVNNGNGTATLGGTPAAGTQGTYHFTIAAHNGVGSGFTQNFTLTVNPASIGGGGGGGGSGGGGGGSGGGGHQPPVLNVPPLLAFFDALLGAIETLNANGTETVTDSILGIPLVVATYDNSGNFVSATLLGINVPNWIWNL
ncbi:MAG TPA: putative Ig domain-containing protein, partial [Gemmataceae bacterium]|nr:putative Ig domain-containing protein [Gemmataceae bacterium]